MEVGEAIVKSLRELIGSGGGTFSFATDKTGKVINESYIDGENSLGKAIKKMEHNPNLN